MHPALPLFNHSVVSFANHFWQTGVVRPSDLQIIGAELAIKWDNGAESYISLENLRRACPCAACQGERDVLGQLHKGPEQTLLPRSFQLTRLVNVGGYGITPIWADGHATGIYPFDYLARIAPARS